MTAARRYRASERALLTELGDGTGVLLDMDSKFYFTLNETAIFVWKLLAARDALSRDQLAAKLCSDFEVEGEQALADVDAMLELLICEHLVTAA